MELQGHEWTARLMDGASRHLLILHFLDGFLDGISGSGLYLCSPRGFINQFSSLLVDYRGMHQLAIYSGFLKCLAFVRSSDSIFMRVEADILLYRGKRWSAFLLLP